MNCDYDSDREVLEIDVRSATPSDITKIEFTF